MTFRLKPDRGQILFSKKGQQKETTIEREADLTGIILAGGQGKRFGKDKGDIFLWGELLIERIVKILSQFFTEILIITSRDKQENYRQKFSSLNINIFPDIFDRKGPLGGLHSGLNFSSNYHSFVVGCDMPFLNPSLINYFKKVSKENDVVVARLKSGFEPLHAIYSKRCLPFIEECIQRNDLRIFDFYDKVKIRILSEEEIERFDPKKLSFFNINTEKDLKEAMRIQKFLTQKRNYQP